MRDRDAGRWVRRPARVVAALVCLAMGAVACTSDARPVPTSATVGPTASHVPPRPRTATLSAPPASATGSSGSATSVPPTPSVARETVGGTIVFSDAGEVYRLDPAAREDAPVALTEDPADEFDPDLSPDGELVAYRMSSGQGDDADIWVMRADGTGKSNVTDAPTDANWGPTWSPDGTRLCFNTDRPDGVNRIWTMAPDGTDLRRVTDGWGEYCDWSPDGERIVYASASGSGTYDLWVTAADGGEPTQLTDLSGTEFFPAWSPDGTWIALTSQDGLRLVATDGTDEQALGDGGWPVWTPDGRLVFDRPGGFAFYDTATGAYEPLGFALGEFPSWVAGD